MIRHGQEVAVKQETGENLEFVLRDTVEKVLHKGFETVAVVCRNEEDADEVRKILKIEEDASGFHNGVMVLPVTLTKGLEFDVVILWKPDEEHYGNNAREAKLLYVAITRALHELYLIGDKKISDLQRRLDAQYDRIDEAYSECTDAEKKQFMQAFIERIDIFPERREDGNWIQNIKFQFPVPIIKEGKEVAQIKGISLDKEKSNEHMVSLEKLSTLETIVSLNKTAI